jgi:hypothetical protein
MPYKQGYPKKKAPVIKREKNTIKAILESNKQKKQLLQGTPK